MSQEKQVSYSHKIQVGENDLDALNHVNNVVYLQWVNDISEKHWNILADEGLRKKYFWVVLRHEIDYMNQAVLGDEIKVVTWVGASKGVRSVRHVEMFIENGDESKILIQARSTWCLIDAKTLRPTRIREDVLDLLTD